MNANLLNRAIVFATKAHAGQFRKGTPLPYIVHPLEALSIVATMTDDTEMMAAAVLHDVVEDTAASIEEIRREFGNRVAALVAVDTNAPRTPDSTWRSRKQAAMDRLAAAPYDGKVVAMGDKLSNLRAIAIDYSKHGEGLWKRFKAPGGRDDIAWYYRGLASSLSELKDTAAYHEYLTLLDKTFEQ